MKKAPFYLKIQPKKKEIKKFIKKNYRAHQQNQKYTRKKIYYYFYLIYLFLNKFILEPNYTKLLIFYFEIFFFKIILNNIFK